MKMIFLPFNKVCEFSGHPSILEVALAHGIPLGHSCGGMGSCTTCLVEVKENQSKLDKPNELEEEHRGARGFKESERLGCQTLAVDGLVVLINSNTI